MTKRSEAAEERRLKRAFARKKKILARLYRYAARHKISVFRPDLDTPPQVRAGRRRQRRNLRHNQTCFLGQTVMSTMHENVDKGALCRPLTCSRCNNGFVNRHRQDGIDRLDEERFNRVRICQHTQNKLLVVPFHIDRSPALLDIPEDRTRMEEIQLVKTLRIGPANPAQAREGIPLLPVRQIVSVGTPNPNFVGMVTKFWAIQDATGTTWVLPLASEAVRRSLNDVARQRQGAIVPDGTVITGMRVLDGPNEIQNLAAILINNHWLLLHLTDDLAHQFGHIVDQDFRDEVVYDAGGAEINPDVARRLLEQMRDARRPIVAQAEPPGFNPPPVAGWDYIEADDPDHMADDLEDLDPFVEEDEEDEDDIF